jgi:hypothetical protein
VARRTDDEHLTLARYAYVPGVTAEEMIIKFHSGSDGYLWVFPRTDHLSIGICATKPNATAGRLEEGLLAFAREHYPEAAGRGLVVKGYFIPSDAAPPARRPGERWALIGDAGGFVDPITREGIAPAMRSAAVLAQHLIAGAGLWRDPAPATPSRPTLTGISLSPSGSEPVEACGAAAAGSAGRDGASAGTGRVTVAPSNPIRTSRGGPFRAEADGGAASSPGTPPLPENLALAHAYKCGFFAESFVERMIWMASGSAAIACVLGDIFEGRQGYRGLKRRLILNALPCGMEMGIGALFGGRPHPDRLPEGSPPSGRRPAA